jgi:hypothetical protein
MIATLALSIDAQELINTLAVATRRGVTERELPDAIYTHTSSTEAFNDVLATIVGDYDVVAGELSPQGDKRLKKAGQ